MGKQLGLGTSCEECEDGRKRLLLSKRHNNGVQGTGNQSNHWAVWSTPIGEKYIIEMGIF